MNNYLARITLLFALWISEANNCKAQYTTGIGMRAGKFASGIDIKHFLNTSSQLGLEFYGGYTLEAHGGYFGKIFVIKQTAIQKSNIPFPLTVIFKQSRLQIPLKFVYGAGIHAGYFKDRFYTIRDGEIFVYGDQIMSAGVDATCGLEYNTRKFPITIGIDATPFYSFINPGPEWLDLGVNVRYIFR